MKLFKVINLGVQLSKPGIRGVGAAISSLSTKSFGEASPPQTPKEVDEAVPSKSHLPTATSSSGVASWKPNNGTSFLYLNEPDPREKAKSETKVWLNNVVTELESQVDCYVAEIEGDSVKKGTTRPPRLAQLETSIVRHKAHIMKLELILRLLDSDELSPEQINDTRDFLEDYLERNQDDFEEFSDVDKLYNCLPLDKAESLEDRAIIGPPSLVKVGPKLLDIINRPGLKAFTDAGRGGGYGIFVTRGIDKHLGIVLGRTSSPNSEVCKFESVKMAMRHLEKITIDDEDIDVFTDYEPLVKLWHKQAKMTKKTEFKTINTIGKQLQKKRHKIDIHHLPRDLNTLAHDLAEKAAALGGKKIIPWDDMDQDLKDRVARYFS